MATELLSDREQEEALRNWWSENWRWVISGIAIGIALVAAWSYWRGYLEQRKNAADTAFSELTAAVASNDKSKVEAIEKNLEDNYSGSPYGDQAHLLLAQAHVAGGRFELAATELKAVVDKSKDVALAAIAKLRLARVQIQMGHHDEALALLDVSKAGAFAAQTYELRGDALLAKGDTAGARQAYQAALTASLTHPGDPSAGSNEYLQLKLQDLAADEAPAKPAPPPTEK